ncbi:Pfs domain protein [Lasiodiplodia theobromae]|uniref:Pfs domain protein n=1 Tax=Lasiodiplodia theobromae TaxID=45133 RepID=UPI0015C37E93|nr:Pfs domain protein [Lasiodiplodia theobromae]KAF4544271.1 Pfs domain protein [Lasiodiplodia theobromae]
MVESVLQAGDIRHQFGSIGSAQRFDSQRSAQVPHEDEWDLIDGNAMLKTNIHQTWNFDLHWEVIDFLNDQLDDPDKLRSYFVVTGTEDRAWASTCLDYLRKLWPDSGENFLESFIALLKNIRSLGKHQIYRLKVSPNLNFRVHMSSSNRTLRFCGYATGHDTVTLMRQLAWIVSVCRVPQDGRLLLSRACIQPNGSERQFSIKVEPLKLAPKTGGSCWHEMFVGYVLAYGFPIPARDFGLGVEMPFYIMTILGLVCYPINYGAGLVLKGDNTALIPSKESSGSNAIQWHFVRSPSADSALSWDSISRRCGPEGVFCETNWKRLADKRAFVGYFPKAEVHLGTDDSGFAHIKPSGAPIDDKRRFNFVNEITGSFGTSGLGIFGGGVSGKAVFHRLSEQRIKAAHGMFWNKLCNAKTQPLLLFDTSTKRGWLVPELSGVLHIALTWASTAEDPAVLAAFDRAQISTDGGAAAYSAIQKASTNSLPGVEDDADFDKEMKVRDIVKRVLESLGQIKEQQQQVAHCSGTLTDGLTGYEYVDIAHFQDTLAAKRVKLDGSCTGDWLKVVKKWPEIAVLLCANLGEPYLD